jgi:hypothetical protein
VNAHLTSSLEEEADDCADEGCNTSVGDRGSIDKGGTSAIFISCRCRCRRTGGPAGSGGRTSGRLGVCGTGGTGGRGAGGRRGGTLDLVLDGLVKGASHAVEGEDGREGEVGVGAVLESGRGDADEVEFPTLAHRGVGDKVDTASCCDVDRFRIFCGWEQMSRVGETYV